MSIPDLIQVNKRKAGVGAVLAAVALLVCGIWYSWTDGVIFAAMFLIAGFLSFRPKHPAVGFLMNGFWGIVCIFLSCVLPTMMVSEESYLNIGYFRILMNFLCAAAFFGIFLTVTGKIKVSIVTASALLLILSTANGFVFQFRGNILQPLDILSAGTAMNVVGQYVFAIKQGMAYSWILWAWMIFCLWSMPAETTLIPKGWFRAAAAAATALCVAVFLYGTRNINMNTWSNQGVTTNGYFLNFAVGLRDSYVGQPEGYSLEALEEAYAEESTGGAREDLPNIIVIMNESFVDFEVLGSEIRTNREVTPFLDSLRENVIRGYALTPVFGGGTANAEFEFLTGFSTSNLPEGSTAYQQYIKSQTFSLVQLLDSLGYKTLATHPYLSTSWSRTTAYPNLGFSEMTFAESYPYEDVIREFVSDREMYGYVLDRLYAQEDSPLFLFGITMQNHGDYNYEGENYEKTISLEGYEMEHPMTEQYLTLIHESDKAVEYLLTELENYPEDTIVLFFGDHFPKVEEDFFMEVHGGRFESLSEQLLQYTVPFFIWANFGIEEQTVSCTSLNYLARYLLEAAGIELSPYHAFLKDMEQVIPSLNADGYYSQSAGDYLPLEDAEGEEAQWLRYYQYLQYNAMFDKEDLSEVFFGQYLKAE